MQWTDTDSLYGSRHLARQMHEARVMVDREVVVSQLETIVSNCHGVTICQCIPRLLVYKCGDL